MKILHKIIETVNKNIIAYHGTGTKFYKFSNDFNSSGLGNNGYGYGIYVTDSRKSAKLWAESLEKLPDVYIDGERQNTEIQKFILNVINTHGTNLELVLHILKTYTDKLMKDNKITLKEFNLINNTNEIKIKRNRFIYKLTIEGDEFINWLSPLTNNQMFKIKKGIEKENIQIDVTIKDDKLYFGNDFINNGEMLYRKLKMIPKEASAFLSRSGIDGFTSYFDLSNNYIIFDPDIIKIDKISTF